MANEIKYVSLSNLDYYDGKIKGHIADADAALKENLEGQVEVVAGALDGEITRAKAAEATNAAAAQAAQEAADKAQGEVDALETYVGTIPTGATATNIVGYVQEKTSGIATDAALGELQSAVDEVEADVETIKGDYLKGTDKTELQGNIDAVAEDVAEIAGDYLKTADKTELSNAITAEADRAKGIEGGLRTDVDTVKADYLKGSDKTELQGNIDTVSGKVTTLIGEDANKSVRTIANEELAKQLIADDAQESLDTLTEIAAWIQSHPNDAAAMNEAIVALQNKVDTGDKNVSTYVTDAINALSIGDYAKAADLTALAGRVTNLETASATHATKDEVDAVSDALTEYTDAHASDYTNTQIEGKITEAISGEVTRVDGELDKKVDKVAGKGLSTNDLTNELKSNYDAAYTHSTSAHAPVDAQANIIESVKVNGAALTITGKAVDISVPTDNAELTNGAGYLVASDIVNKADKATTLAGYGIADAYTSAETDTAIANAIGQFEECTSAEIDALFA